MTIATPPETPEEIAALINEGFFTFTDRGTLHGITDNMLEGVKQYRRGLVALVEADDGQVAEALKRVDPDALRPLVALAIIGLRRTNYTDVIVERGENDS